MIEIVLLGLIIIGLIIFISFVPFNLWLDATFARVAIDLLDMVGMVIRRVPSKLIVQSQIDATKAGLKISTNDLEAIYLAGGNVQQVVNAMIAAETLTLSWRAAVTFRHLRRWPPSISFADIHRT